MIKPLFKKKDAAQCGNYCVISLAARLGKHLSNSRHLVRDQETAVGGALWVRLPPFNHGNDVHGVQASRAWKASYACRYFLLQELEKKAMRPTISVLNRSALA